MSYCKFSQTNNLHKHYHDKEYGFPVASDDALFERLVLEINQAGLSWDLMLKKRAGFNQAFHGFDVELVAKMKGRDVARLLKDAGIIRNRQKIEAAIHNANIIMGLQRSHGSFAAWLWYQAAGQDVKAWTLLFKKQGFKFIGGEIMKEFLQSVGHLPSPHDKNCPVNQDIFKAKVLAVVKAIPKGETMTYGEVARLAGRPQAARAVGALMRANKDKRIPCHRVIAISGLGGYNGLRGKSKAKLLAGEKRK